MAVMTETRKGISEEQQLASLPKFNNSSNNNNG